MSPRAQRADAVDNRERIVAAARAALSGSDTAAEQINLKLIAQTAGVGQGTLYRHFPTRDHLLAEAYRDELGELVDAVPALLDHHEPVEALSLWFERLLDYARVKRGVIAAIAASTWQDLYAAEHHRLDRALEALLDKGRTAGDIRADVDATDVILLLGALSRVPDADWDVRAHVVVDVIVDGVRTRS